MNVLKGDLKSQLVWCRRAQWGLLGTLFIFVAGIYFLCIRTADTDLQLMRARYTAAELELQQNQDQTKNLPKVEMEIAQLRQRVERFDKKIPKKQDLDSFVGDVYRISQQSALKNMNWHLDSKARRADQFIEMPIQFSFEGDFQTGVAQFLSGLEDLSRLTRVHKLDLKSIDGGSGTVKADVTMNIYFGEE